MALGARLTTSKQNICCDKSISSAIQTLICSDARSNIYSIIPKDLIKICLKYIGFIIDSKILKQTEQISLYQLLIQHHQDRNIESPLTNINIHSIKYFNLLYRSCDYDNPSFMNAIQNKAHIVVVFHTNYNDVFSIYLHKPWIVVTITI